MTAAPSTSHSSNAFRSPRQVALSVAPAGKRRYLTDAELEAMFEALHVPDGGRQRIRHIRESLPARATASTSYTGKLRYPSLKMGFTMEAEAYRTEMVAITEWDHDDETLELYTQPHHRLKITYRSGKSGKLTTTLTVPDAFRITRAAFIFTECKMEEFLESECVLQPDRYVRRADGSWSSPPAEEAAAKLGCRYELRSSATNNWALHENLELLHDFYVAKEQGIRLDVREEVTCATGSTVPARMRSPTTAGG